MTSKPSRRIGNGWRAGALALAVLAAGCAGKRPSGDAEPDTAPGEARESKWADPIARFALQADPGNTATLAVEDERVHVTVGEMYDSAAGLRCRRVTLRRRGNASTVSAVCREDGVWRTLLLHQR